MMPKDPWKYKRGKRGSEEKVQDDLLECSSLPDPCKQSTFIVLNPEMALNNRVKIKGKPNINLDHPDTRFARFETLFPAGNTQQSGSFKEAVKRTAEEKLLTTASKIAKRTDSSETTEATLSDDCIIIEPASKKAKIEVIDLTEDISIASMACTPVRTTFMNMKPNIFKVNGKVCTKVESENEICEIINDSDINYTIQDRPKENKASKHVDATICSSGLETKNDINVEKYSEAYDQVKMITDSFRVVKYASKNNPINNVRLKTEQNKNCAVSNNYSISVSRTSAVNQIDTNHVIHPAESDNNKANKSKEVNENNSSVPVPFITLLSESSSGLSFGTENLLNVINKQQTKEKVEEWLSSCSVNFEKAQENVVCHETNKSTVSDHAVSLTSPQVKAELEDTYSQEISFSSERTHPCEYSLLKMTDTSILSTETLVSNELTLNNTSPVTDIEIFSMFELDSFSIPMLKYLNLNTKVDQRELSSALSYLHHMIKIQEERSIHLGQIPKKKDHREELLSSDLCQILDKVKQN